MVQDEPVDERRTRIARFKSLGDTCFKKKDYVSAAGYYSLVLLVFFTLNCLLYGNTNVSYRLSFPTIGHSVACIANNLNQANLTVTSNSHFH